MPFLFHLAPTVLDPWVLHEVSADSPSKGATVSLKPALVERLEASLLPNPPAGSLSPGAVPNATAGRTSLCVAQRAHGAAPAAAVSSPEPKRCALSQNGYVQYAYLVYMNSIQI